MEVIYHFNHKISPNNQYIIRKLIMYILFQIIIDYHIVLLRDSHVFPKQRQAIAYIVSTYLYIRRSDCGPNMGYNNIDKHCHYHAYRHCILAIDKVM